jgi:NitT/TauT family transport system substrate-binding protein
MQAKGQPVVAVTQYGRYPGFVLATVAAKSTPYRGPQSLKGLKIGVTSPGSSTHFMAAYMLVRSGLKADDASFVGTGVTSTAVAAARRAEIDAIVSSDPMISLMQSERLVDVVADTRTPEGTQAVYGGPYPGGVVYTTPAFLERNPRTVQAVVTAFVRALKWMSVHSAEDIARAMPEEYALGNREVYVRALTASQRMYSPDGRFVSGAVETAHQVLKVFDPAVAGATVDLSKTHTGAFVEKALAAN